MNPILRRFADHTAADSVATKMRQSRFGLFRDFVDRVWQAQGAEGDIRVLDVGGAPHYWHNMTGFDTMPVAVTVLNLAPFEGDGRVKTVIGDACQMPEYTDHSWDIVFSNSVIEHVGDFEKQAAMAGEVGRIGRNYFVQTPNRYFPIEPHFLIPFFQFMPLPLKVKLASYRPGWYGRYGLTREETIYDAQHLRLMSKRDLIQVFPHSTIWHEKWFGLTKSFVTFKYATQR